MRCHSFICLVNLVGPADGNRQVCGKDVGAVGSRWGCKWFLVWLLDGGLWDNPELKILDHVKIVSTKMRTGKAYFACGNEALLEAFWLAWVG